MSLFKKAAAWRDVVLAALLFTYATVVLEVAGSRGEGVRGADALAYATVGLMTGALAVRRRFPLQVLLVQLGCVAVFQQRGYADEPPVVVVLIALYTVAATGHRRRSVKIGAVVAVLVQVMLMGTEPDMGFAEVLDAALMVVLAMALGEAVRYQRAYRDEVVRRRAQEEFRRVEESQRLLDEERLRIARDLHDVLAHGIAAINVQAGVAAHLLDGAKEVDERTLALLRSTMEAITEVSRSGVDDLRATLTLLRGHDPRPDGPLPGLVRLDELADMVTATGPRVEVQVVGDARPLPPVHDVAAFRIVQEALTNVVKHARARSVLVRIAYSAGAVELTVRDDGIGRAAQPAAGHGGFGLLGMTERAHSVGGRVSAAAGPGGGFTVDAVLPLPEQREPAPAGR
ncbi:sensor histidine kinase [Streptomyces sp. NPDC002057]|uniref:sensor histidine kinase n=1 Tax=Streptomyces sp. NPDC002057 TaxID=3154664 RepID=UPI003319129D